MIYQERLLQRIKHQEHAPSERASGNLALETASILEHLRRLLNTRQGSVPIRPDYGIPDFSHLGGDTFTDTALEMQRSIRLVIEAFEPRLARVQVAFDTRGGERSHLRFRITGVLAKDERVPLALDTTLAPGGRFNVSP
ncbi:type VI secretion system baseplate subunit TssE [Mesoterricola silvestris]|uniref:Type VI secretion protein n=1 Tax=Mesoterricola silvestris TaxID=2927979 RepID=A0AA48GTG5_9BACT|nr:type VI secretion system baseplate subunit TssE [Mesoterricola silvestris]BDU73727.1 type VI secretion protein [Mesoterricola silvestris]